MNIQWYPGHMTKTKRMIQENISLVDIVIELLDARIPASSKNPDIDAFANGKHRIVLLNKSDLADAAATAQWAACFESKGFSVILTDSTTGKGLDRIYDVSRGLMREKIERLKSRGRVFVPVRAMIVGVPNVGKSTLINKLVGKAPAKTGDKPGVTKGKQWVKIKKDFELLDTPGILWPKFDDEKVGLHLAFTGAINDDIMDIYTLGLKLIEKLLQCKPGCLRARYDIDDETGEPPEQLLRKIAAARGFKIKGGALDVERAAVTLVDEYRGCRLGRMTLETPEELK